MIDENKDEPRTKAVEEEVAREMDGVPEHSQPVVEPGGTFTYEFTLTDAGTFWYHPHLHGSTALQVSSGARSSCSASPRLRGSW